MSTPEDGPLTRTQRSQIYCVTCSAAVWFFERTNIGYQEVGMRWCRLRRRLAARARESLQVHVHILPLRSERPDELCNFRDHADYVPVTRLHPTSNTCGWFGFGDSFLINQKNSNDSWKRTAAGFGGRCVTAAGLFSCANTRPPSSSIQANFSFPKISQARSLSIHMLAA